MGRRSRRWRADDPDTHGPALAPVPVCPLCERPIPGHARYSEAEIARRLADVEALRADPEIADFLAWVRGKPPDFHAPTRMTRARRGVRRRD